MQVYLLHAIRISVNFSSILKNLGFKFWLLTILSECLLHGWMKPNQARIFAIK